MCSVQRLDEWVNVDYGDKIVLTVEEDDTFALTHYDDDGEVLWQSHADCPEKLADEAEEFVKGSPAWTNREDLVLL